MTGTPLENSLMDLWALLSITAPGLFPDAAAVRRVLPPTDRAGPGRERACASCADGSGRSCCGRTKEQVAAELPPKQEQVVEVVLHPRHQRLYQTHLQRERQKVLGLIEDLQRNRFTIFRSLTLLRRLSLDAALVDPRRTPACRPRKVDVLSS